MKRKISLMLTIILIMQILLPMLTIIVESKITIKSIAASQQETTVDGITWVYTLSNGKATNVRPKDKNSLPQVVTIPTSLDGYTVTSIGNNAFEGCGNLKSIIISENVTSIGNYAFNRCSNLTSINIPEGVTSIGDSAIQACENLEDIHFPSTLVNIGRQAFMECSKLKSINVPDSVTSIGPYAFARCSNLEFVKTPNTIKSMGSRIFQDCIRLMNIELPYSAEFMGDNFFNSTLLIFTTINEQSEQVIELPTTIKRATIEGDILYSEGGFELKNCTLSVDGTKVIFSKEQFKNGNEISLEAKDGLLKGLKVIITSDEITWDISKNENSDVKAVFNYNEKLLTIAGNGEMKDFGWDCGPWYYLRNYIENATIGYGVTTIGTYCFFDNDGISNIDLPESIKLIAPYAFRGCSGLEIINIPEGTKIIDTGAFSLCNNLKEVNISSTVFGIGIGNVTFVWDEGMLEGLTITSTGEVFKGCTSLKSINVNSNNKYYSSFDGVLYNKNKTTLMNYPAGKENEEFSIPDGVTEIYANAFDSCVNLKTIEIPGTVNELKDQCFRGSKLNSIILNEGLKKIGEYAFYENNSIEEIYIPSSVESIGEGALCKMDKLKAIEVNPDNNNYFSEKGILFSKDKTKIIQYPENKEGNTYIIPDTVESIETGAFAYGNNLYYLKINEGVSKIGTSAFVFSNLKGVYIPNSVKEIGVFNVGGDITPFEWCYNDCKIYCNNNSYAKDFCIQYSLNYSTDVEEFFEQNFSNQLNYIAITTPPTKTNYIAGQNFDKTGMVITATYSDGSTKEVTNYEVTDGENLAAGKTNVTISYTEGGVTKTTTQNITVVAGEQEATVDGITWVYTLSDGKATDVKPKDKNSLPQVVTIPTSLDGYTVTSIGSEAFYCCDIESITIPEGVTSIGDYAFFCSNLKNIEISNSVTSIGIEVFSGCYSLVNINVRENNKKYSSINGVLFNKDKTEIIKYPQGRKDITYIIPEGVTSIGNGAFNGCTNLTSINIPEGVTSIGYSAFSGCNNLENIEIPSSVTNIEYNTFHACSSLKNINVKENNNNYSSIDGVLFNKDKTEITRYPEGREDTKYTIPGGVTSIGTSSFANCNTLKSIVIPNNVTTLSKSAFFECNNITIYCKDNSAAKQYAIDKKIKYEIDETSPLIESVTGNPENWTNENVTLVVNASDSLSGLAQEAYSFDGGITWQEENSKTYEENTNGIVIKVRDNLGNESTYSEEINITKIVLKGDANGDGKVDFNDILTINKHRLGKIELTEERLVAADVTKDGIADFSDILQINKYRLGKISSL